MGLIDIAGAILSRSSQSVEVSAQNVANMVTPGYKTRHRFPAVLESQSLVPSRTAASMDAVDLTPGKLQNTGNPFDLAISGSGFFVVRSGDQTFYTRAGAFKRESDGHLVTHDGMVLQATSGDFIIRGSDMQVLTDGTIVDGGEPVAQLAIVNFADPSVLGAAGSSLFTAPSDSAVEVASPEVRQGMIEASNVSTADEIISVMAALRGAESGQRVAQVYDDLMGRTEAVFGQQQ